MSEIQKSGFSFRVPIRTISELNRRGKEHWSVRDRRVKGQRFATKAAWIAAGSPSFPIPCEVLLVRIAPRSLDKGDNLNSAMKAIRDEIADIIGIDDKHSDKLDFNYDQRKPDKPKTYAVDVSVRSK